MLEELEQMEFIDVDSLDRGEYDRVLYDKFIEAYDVEDMQVLTPDGYVKIEGIGKTILFDEWELYTSGGKKLICADKHILYRCDNINFENQKCDLTEIFTMDLKLGDFVMTADGPEMIMDIFQNGEKSHMYDLQLDRKSKKQYYTNGFLSHNSLWMQNLTVKTANAGHNVLYITLEMSEKKVMKRLGAMRLNIPINDYDQKSRDTNYVKKQIDNLKNRIDSGDLFQKKVGKIFTKFWAAGTASVDDFDAFIEKFQEKKGIKIDMVVVDYITLIAQRKGVRSDSLYVKGKNLAEELRALASKYNVPVITAIQVAKDAWNATDITLESIPESKAIAETCDSFFAIIRSEAMRRNNVYRLKLLKQRDGDFSKSQIKFDLNPTYLIIENDQFIDVQS